MLRDRVFRRVTSAQDRSGPRSVVSRCDTLAGREGDCRFRCAGALRSGVHRGRHRSGVGDPHLAVVDR